MLTLHFPQTKDKEMESPVIFYINLNVRIKNTEYWASDTVTRQRVGILDVLYVYDISYFIFCLCM